jgi:hypothetical protein
MKIPRFQKRDRRMRQVSKSGRPKPTTLEHTLEPIMSLSIPRLSGHGYRGSQHQKTPNLGERMDTPSMITFCHTTWDFGKFRNSLEPTNSPALEKERERDDHLALNGPERALNQPSQSAPPLSKRCSRVNAFSPFSSRLRYLARDVGKEMACTRRVFCLVSWGKTACERPTTFLAALARNLKELECVSMMV